MACYPEKMTLLEKWTRGTLNLRATARTLLEGWPKKAGEPVELQALANRLGELRKGKNTGWWEERQELLKALATYLQTNPDELLGRSLLPEGALPFAEFPDLPALHPSEDPCLLTPRGWLMEEALHQLSGNRWVVAPPGAGKTLMLQRLGHRHPGEVAAATASTLEEAAGLALTPLPLVVEVEEARPLKDALALRPLTERSARTIVLAPFEFPEPLWSVPGGRVGRSSTGWESVRVSFRTDWRQRLLDWVQLRLETAKQPTRLKKQDVLAWLAKHDPYEIHVTTPGALLALCADFDQRGPEGASFAVRAERWVTRAVPSLLPSDTPPTWRAHVGARAVAGIAKAQFRQTRARFPCSSKEAWEAFVPTEVLPAQEGQPGAALVVGYLHHAGLLRGEATGVGIYPSWVALGLVVRALEEDLDDTTLSWGRFAADETRRALVDAALGELPTGTLRRLVSTVDQHGEPRTLAAVGALEATLAEIGRRVDLGTFTTNEREHLALQRLLLRGVGTLGDPQPGGECQPRTRPDREEWLATAWVVSMTVPAPQKVPASISLWHLPGWAPSLKATEAKGAALPTSHLVPDPTSPHPMPGLILASPGLKVLENNQVDGLRGEASEHFARLARRTLLLAGKFDASVIPPDVPRLLLPALFLHARRQGWVLGPEHLKALRHRWEETFLGESARREPLEEQEALAGMLWELVGRRLDPEGKATVAERIQMLRMDHPGLAFFVLESVPPHLVAATAQQHGTHRRGAGASIISSEPQLLLHLPRATREQALRAWLAGVGAREAGFDEARQLVPLLDGGDMELALDLVRAAERDVAVEFCGFVWAVAPARAREEARRAIQRALPSAPGWCHTAPREELEGLAGVIEQAGGRPTWVRAWAARRLLDAGEAGERLFKLLHDGTTSPPPKSLG